MTLRHVVLLKWKRGNPVTAPRARPEPSSVVPLTGNPQPVVPHRQGFRHGQDAHEPRHNARRRGIRAAAPPSRYATEQEATTLRGRAAELHLMNRAWAVQWHAREWARPRPSGPAVHPARVAALVCGVVLGLILLARQPRGFAGRYARHLPHSPTVSSRPHVISALPHGLRFPSVIDLSPCASTRQNRV